MFSLRSDFLYLLDELSADIPAILRCRFQLRPLDRDRAEAAITRPAAMPGDFASPAFGYSPDALDGILETLGRKGASSLGSSVTITSQPDAPLGEIAAFQLQMVCQHLEGRIIEQKRAAGFQITPAFYGYAGGIERIINEFYKGVLEKIPAAEQEAVQKLLARGLIRNGRRIMVEASVLRDEYGVPQPTLELLHAERLLKRETRKGELYYEISHDTLVVPVLERFKAVEEAELRAKAEAAERELAVERQRAEEAERLKNEAITAQQAAERAKRLSQKFGILATLVGLAALASLVGLESAYKYSKREKEKAEIERNKAIQSDSLAQVAKKEAIEKSIAAQRSDSLARVNLAKAKTEEANAKAALAKAKAAEQAKQKTEITRLLSEADTYQRAKLYKNARAKCEAVLKLDPENREAKQKLQELQ